VQRNSIPQLSGLDEDALTRSIVALASRYGRYGYRRITSPSVGAGWQVSYDRVQRIWRREAIWIAMPSCSRLNLPGPRYPSG
jgi:hypothetical protein